MSNTVGIMVGSTLWTGAVVALSLGTLPCHPAAAETLPPLDGRRSPQNLDELWADYDPGKEPLDVQIVREWHEEGTTLRVVRYNIGTFRGQVSKMAAFYAFPEEARTKKLPALIHLHGGGQRASLDNVRYAADNGYVGTSINWGAMPMDGAPEGEANTDWGAVDATQQGHNGHYAKMTPDDLTLDPVESPRNNNWFLLILAARRGLTFLEQQPEVDASRLGVLGHSMGGKLTVDLTGIDRRIKAAAPSCGGAGTVAGAPSGMPGFVRKDTSEWFNQTIADNPYIERITAPILFCSPTNDFNGPLDNMYYNSRNLPREQVRYSISPHLNHRHLPEFAITRMLWFEQHLKGTFQFPTTPSIEVNLSADGGIPEVVVKPDTSKKIERVDVYYSVDPHVLTRFWRDAKAERIGSQPIWHGTCPDVGPGQPLFVFAGVTYALDHPVTTVRQRKPYGGDFAISSEMLRFSARDLKEAGVRATSERPLSIDDFQRGWHDWYQINWGHPPLWQAWTRKLKDPLWRGRDGAKLAVDVRSTDDNTLAIGVKVNDWGAFGPGVGGEFLVQRQLDGSPDWQTVTVSSGDFLPSENNRDKQLPLTWDRVTELYLGAGGDRYWKGEREFRNLRWVIEP